MSGVRLLLCLDSSLIAKPEPYCSSSKREDERQDVLGPAILIESNRALGVHHRSHPDLAQDDCKPPDNDPEDEDREENRPNTFDPIHAQRFLRGCRFGKNLRLMKVTVATLSQSAEQDL
jgi:hypothetical protein